MMKSSVTTIIVSKEEKWANDSEDANIQEKFDGSFFSYLPLVLGYCAIWAWSEQQQPLKYVTKKLNN